MTEAPHQFGPAYNIDGASLQKFRRSARKGLAAMPYNVRKDYGAAVLAAVLSKQRMPRRGTAPTRCASQTLHTTGKAILNAIRNRLDADLRACPDKIRKNRTPNEWKAMYQAAMEAKRRTTTKELEQA